MTATQQVKKNKRPVAISVRLPPDVEEFYREDADRATMKLGPYLRSLVVALRAKNKKLADFLM